MKFLWLLFGVFALSPCNAEEDSVSRLLISTFVNCLNGDISLCLKEHALKATERIGTLRALKITDQLTLINQDPKGARSLAPLSTELEARRQQVSQRLWDSTSELLQNSDLEYTFDGDDEEESRAIGDVEESRGKKKEKKKKIKLLLSLAILGKIKAVILVIAFLGIIAASLFKIALIVKIAFIAKIIAIIKALLAKKHMHEEEAWIPHHVEHHDHHDHHPPAGWEGAAPAGWSGGGAGWSRSAAQNLAYSAYKK